MVERLRRSRTLTVLALACLVLTAGARRAAGHALRVFATAEGTRISGYAYFPGGGRAKGVEVRVLGPEGRVLARTTTDRNGGFAVEAHLRCDHEVVVQSPDGHRATFTVAAEQLPAELPAPEMGEERSPAGPGETTPAGGASPGESPGPDELRRVVERAVSRQVRPLREELDRLRARRRIQDVLGGIGYILGLTGVAFYFLGRRRRRAD